MEQTVQDLIWGLELAGKVIFALEGTQWEWPTPCPEWDVAEVVRHLVRGNLSVARALGPGGTPPVRKLATLAGPGYGAHPPAGRTASENRSFRPSLAETFERTGNELIHAFTWPGALERRVTIGFGDVPGLLACRIRTVDVLVHAWDIRSALGENFDVPDDFAERLLELSSEQLGALPADRRPFAPPRPVPEGSPAIDRLAALLGREVPWPRPLPHL